MRINPRISSIYYRQRLVGLERMQRHLRTWSANESVDLRRRRPLRTKNADEALRSYGDMRTVTFRKEK